MKRAIAVPIALLVLVFSAINASAGQPVRFAAQFPDHLIISCPNFQMVVTAPVNKEYITIFESTDTTFRGIITGRLVLTYTNPINGKTVTANASGPGFEFFSNGTSVSISTGLYASDTIHAGRLVTTVYPDGHSTFTIVGHTLLDVCAALA